MNVMGSEEKNEKAWDRPPSTASTNADEMEYKAHEVEDINGLYTWLTAQYVVVKLDVPP